MNDLIELLRAFDPLAGTPARKASGDSGRYVLLDVFTDTPLTCNQLAVFSDARGVRERDMQPLARELKLSETVFVLPPSSGGDVSVRIFTPFAELPFAGHPVLGTAFVVGSALDEDNVTLETKIGPIEVSLQRDSARAGSGWMQQPIPTWQPFAREQELLRALGVDRATLPVEVYDNGPKHVYVSLESESAVAALKPDLGALLELGEIGVSCFAGADSRWRTRMFAPALGVPEDPATGSAAGPLAVHLCRHGAIDFDQQIQISQGEAIDRPSLLLARIGGSREEIRSVAVGGATVILGQGEFLLD
jgi:trans-2,3-dihydro-3-hydroxyanthranilate isomerase